MTEAHNPYKKTKTYRHAMEAIFQEAENAMMDVYRKYVLIHFNVLIDNGWGEIRLNRNKDHFDEILKRYEEEENGSARYLAQELRDRVGLVFEEP